MKTNDFSDILQALEQVRESGKEILVITHERPDGDAVGSFSAMVELLRSNGFAAAWYLQDPVPDCYTSFLTGENAKITSAADVNERYSLIFNVDASTVKRLGISPAAFVLSYMRTVSRFPFTGPNTYIVSPSRYPDGKSISPPTKERNSPLSQSRIPAGIPSAVPFFT